MKNESVFYNIINELCIEKGIEQELLSFDWIRQLKKDGKIRNLIRYQFDLNSYNASRIAGDKYATYALLSKNNIPIMEHKMIFNPESREEYFAESQIEDAIKLLHKNKRIIIKANQSSKGKHVFLCHSESEVRKTITELLEQNKDSLSACPFLNIDYEYRAVYLLGEILYIYKKEKPYVIGNGKNTIEELIKSKFGEEFVVNYIDGVDYKSILQCGEKKTISWKHNLCNGASPVIIDEKDYYYQKVKEMALASGKIININFATVDIALTDKKELLVMEINSSVCMDKFAEFAPNGYEITKKIYDKAIDAMFNY